MAAFPAASVKLQSQSAVHVSVRHWLHSVLCCKELSYRTSHKILKSLPLPLGARLDSLYNVRMYTNLSNPLAVLYSSRTANLFLHPNHSRPLSHFSALSTSHAPILPSLSERLCAARQSKNHASFTPGLPRPVGGEHTTHKVASPASPLIGHAITCRGLKKLSTSRKVSPSHDAS
jgi:hypothetical protein